MPHPYLAHPGPVGIAHRGAHGDGAGENSDLAFARAGALGYRHLETDVQRTADGVLVAMHDDVLDRTTDGAGPVEQLRWRDVARLEVRGGGGVPRLVELLASYPDVRWNLDCKQPHLAADVAELVRNDLDRVCVGSFHRGAVRRLRQLLGPALCTAATPAEVRTVVAASLLPEPARLQLGRVLGRRLRCDALQVPPVHEGRTIVTAPFVEVAHAAGIDVHVWTVDDAGEQDALLDLGVDGIMTDDASGLAGLLLLRGQWPPRGVPGAPSSSPVLLREAGPGTTLPSDEEPGT